jgi:molybdopterin molybdotransferase
VTLLQWRQLAAAVASLATPVRGLQHVSLHGAAGRVLAADVAATRPLPSMSHAVMDGYALGSLPPGSYRIIEARPERLGVAEAVGIAAGTPVPRGAAAVALADKARRDGADLHVAAPQTKDNIRRAGEEAAAGDRILSAGLRLDARHLALAAAAGVATLPVRSRPRVAVVALHEGEEHLPHLGIAGALLGDGVLRTTGIAALRAERLAGELARLSAGSDAILVVSDSLGDENGPLAAALAAAGGEARVLRARMKPAKPVIAGRIGEAMVVGLAGTAYAVAVAAHLFLRPALVRLAGLPEDDMLQPAVLGFDREREPGRAEALPVRLGSREGAPLLLPAGRFGQLTALAAMDGIALVEAEAASLEAGASCLYQPLLMPLI